MLKTRISGVQISVSHMTDSTGRCFEHLGSRILSLLNFEFRISDLPPIWFLNWDSGLCIPLPCAFLKTFSPTYE